MHDNDSVELPETLTLEQAFSAAFFMIEIYGEIENWKSDDIFLYYDYMRSDPARWGDWQDAVRRALANPETAFEEMATWRQRRDLHDGVPVQQPAVQVKSSRANHQ